MTLIIIDNRGNDTQKDMSYGTTKVDDQLIQLTSNAEITSQISDIPGNWAIYEAGGIVDGRPVVVFWHHDLDDYVNDIGEPVDEDCYDWDKATKFEFID